MYEETDVCAITTSGEAIVRDDGKVCKISSIYFEAMILLQHVKSSKQRHREGQRGHLRHQQHHRHHRHQLL